MERLKPGQEISVHKKHQSPGINPANPIISKGVDLFVRRVEKKILIPLQPNYEDGFRDKFVEVIEDSDVLPVAVITHQSHSDCISAAKLSKDLTTLANQHRYPEEEFRGYMLSVAASMQSGHQNIVVQQYFETTKSIASKYNLRLQTYVRQKDENQYGISRSKNIQFSRELARIINKQEDRQADGLIFFPEGTMEGGRKVIEGTKKGQINGMQELDWESIHKLIKGIEERGRKVVIIPVGTHGEFRISNPSNKNYPTARVLKQLYNPLNIPRESILSVNVGMPMTYSEIKEILAKQGIEPNPQNIGEYVGRTIAKLLPLEARGVYA